MKYLLLLILLTGCYTQKKGTQQSNRFIDTYPGPAGKWFRDKYPCIPGTTVTDSTAYKQYLADLKAMEELYGAQEPPVNRTDTFIISWADTTKIQYLARKGQEKDAEIARQKAKYAELLKVCRDKPAIHDTIPTSDKSDTFICESENVKLRAEADIKDRKIEGKNKLVLWLLIPLIISILLNLIQFKRK